MYFQLITHLNIGYNGRLGNQLFIYATLYALSQELGFDPVIPAENTINTKQDGCLDLYHNKWIPYKCYLYDYFKNLSIPLKPLKEITQFIPNLFVERDINYHSELFDIKDGTDISGYFQSYKYFDGYKEELRREFTFKPEIQVKVDELWEKYNPSNLPSIAIHIRLGDSLGHASVYKPTPEYISEGISQIYASYDNFIVDFPNLKILVFSDNIPYISDWFLEEENVTLVQETTDYQDLALMQKCDHFIMSPSTFSFWASYLGEKNNSNIIFPAQWWGNNREGKSIYDLNSMLPKHYKLL